MDSIKRTFNRLTKMVMEEGVEPLSRPEKNVIIRDDRKDKRARGREGAGTGADTDTGVASETESRKNTSMSDSEKPNKTRTRTRVGERDREKIDNQEFVWDIIDHFFTDNPGVLVKHHIDSYNQFFKKDIKNIFREKNPITILKEPDEESGEYALQAKLYLAGKSGEKIYYGKPMIFDETRQHYMYPNEARLRNMTYAITLHIDIDVEYRIQNQNPGEAFETTTTTIERVYLGRFPVMLNSYLCILNGLDRLVKFNLGECRNDLGGYFIIDGKEKAIVSQEKFADNMLYVRDKYNELYSHSAEIRSVSEDASKPIRTMAVRIVAPSARYTNRQIVVNVPNVRKPVPLFILMRALGVESDKKIISYCLLDLEKNAEYIDLFAPSVHDAGKIFNQITALKYIATFTKGKSIPQVLYILMDFFLPHIGETNFREKAFFLGHMVFEVLKVYKNAKKATDRDSFNFKRVELPGTLIRDLFKEYYTLQQKHIFQKIDKEYYYKQGIYRDNFPSLIENNVNDIFRERILEAGFRKAFKGSWGSEEHTKRPGVVQGLNRLSFNSAISHLRKLNLPFDSSAKIVGPRLLHSSQWGIIDPVDTPDGGNVGLHKHMTMMANITSGCSGKPLIEWLKNVGNIEPLNTLGDNMRYISQATRVFVNGAWIGVTNTPAELVQVLRLYRRNGLIYTYTSVSWDIQQNTVFLYTDAGRLCRPLFYVENSTPSYKMLDGVISERIETGDYKWSNLVAGFNSKKNTGSGTESEECVFYEKIDDRLTVPGGSANKREMVETIKARQAILDYIDTAESETSLIATTAEKITPQTTNLEIHPSLLMGVMGNQVVFPEHNQLPRNLFSCGQTKQAVGLYHSNFHNRIDKMGVILNYGEMPLVKSRYLKYINNEEHPCGFNAIVAIGCYGSYNVEDSILFNEASLKRGMFRTTYYNMYETYEESSKVGNSVVDTRFANIEEEKANGGGVIGTKPGYDYSALDRHGLIRENTLMDEKKVVIGKITTGIGNNREGVMSTDNSITPKKGQLGYVDKSFMTEGEEGFRIAKVRIREERVPAIGDKFCSRCGQKGTIGLVIPEADMPFTANGMRPDLIINPHALPSRMTIGQLVETLMGKACALYGGYGDCTAFVNEGSRHEVMGRLLTQIGYKSSGNEILYSGETGEPLENEIFIGPCYYMRLKHMVKDKINYRAQGPRTVLTRQTVQGRANDGGLRIGEMERDGVIGHGATAFLRQSMLERGDDYYMAICNKTGMIAVYNESNNVFMSLLADGPVKFNKSVDDIKLEHITKYGRSFSIVRVPYSFKLLLQELQVMNVQMRIITEDNIDQFDSMANISGESLLRKDEKESNVETIDLSEVGVQALALDTNSDSKGDKGAKDDDQDSVYDPDDMSIKAVSHRVREESVKKAEDEYNRYLTEDEDEEDAPLEPLTIGETVDEKELGITSLEDIIDRGGDETKKEATTTTNTNTSTTTTVSDNNNDKNKDKDKEIVLSSEITEIKPAEPDLPGENIILKEYDTDETKQLEQGSENNASSGSSTKKVSIAIS